MTDPRHCVTRFKPWFHNAPYISGKEGPRKRIQREKQKVKYAAVMQLFFQYLAKGKTNVPFPFRIYAAGRNIPAYILKETCFFDLVVHASVNRVGGLQKEKCTRTNRVRWDSIGFQCKYSNDKVKFEASFFFLTIEKIFLKQIDRQK